MEQNKTSYKNIAKATSLFGGVQVFQIILNLIRGKIIALLLGANGMGINSLLVSSITMINNVSSLGLNFSAVRDISKSAESGDINKISITLSVFRKWLIFTSFLGCIIVICASPLLSHFAFNNQNYTWDFMLLAPMLAFNTLTAGNTTLLQGTRNLKSFAKLSLTGSIIALLISSPLYYYWGIKAIVPSLILASFISYLFSIYYASKIKVTRVNVSTKETINSGLDMVKLGITMMVATFLGSFVSYLINTFICNQGSTSDLGLYQAGMSITSQSIGLVFTAMSIDYFPRLSAISEDNSKVKEMANQQGEITLLLATPILILLAITAPLLIHLLLSNEFLPITTFIRVLAFGIIFKAASYSIGAISFAKGDKKTFFLLEGCYTNLNTLLFNIVGYWVGGLTGLAYSFLLMHITYFLVINIVTSKLYNFSINKDLKKILVTQIMLISMVFLSFIIFNNSFAYITSVILALISILFSYKQLDQRIGISELLSKTRTYKHK